MFAMKLRTMKHGLDERECDERGCLFVEDPDERDRLVCLRCGRTRTIEPEEEEMGAGSFVLMLLSAIALALLLA